MTFCWMPWHCCLSKNLHWFNSLERWLQNFMKFLKDFFISLNLAFFQKQSAQRISLSSVIAVVPPLGEILVWFGTLIQHARESIFWYGRKTYIWAPLYISKTFLHAKKFLCEVSFGWMSQHCCFCSNFHLIFDIDLTCVYLLVLLQNFLKFLKDLYKTWKSVKNFCR